MDHAAAQPEPAVHPAHTQDKGSQERLTELDKCGFQRMLDERMRIIAIVCGVISTYSFTMWGYIDYLYEPENYARYVGVRIVLIMGFAGIGLYLAKRTVPHWVLIAMTYYLALAVVTPTATRLPLSTTLYNAYLFIAILVFVLLALASMHWIHTVIITHIGVALFVIFSLLNPGQDVNFVSTLYFLIVSSWLATLTNYVTYRSSRLEFAAKNQAQRALAEAAVQRDEAHRQRAENLVMMEQLAVMARQDHLTGLANRRTFDEFLETHFEIAMNNQSTIGMIIFDIDLFKNINDTYGHHAGDAVLCEVAHNLGQQFRHGDLVARYGGEEFVAVLPDTNLSDILTIAERARGCIKRTIREGKMAEVLDDVPVEKVTMSAGVALAPLHATTVSKLISSADQALYRAKAAGRARTLVAPTPSFPQQIARSAPHDRKKQAAAH